VKYFILLSLFLPFTLHAGYFELGLSGNYRKLNLPSETPRDAFDTTTSFSGSFAYYFAEMAAVEFNYTKGQSERYVTSTTADSRTTYDFTLAGMDLVLTFADRKAAFIPYLKAGLAYFIDKKVTYEFVDNTTPTSSRPPETVPLDPTLVPSVGIGLKVRLSERLSFKFGMEAWTNNSIDKDPVWDVAGRAGISWFL
jgi:hypothetical protein